MLEGFAHRFHQTVYMRRADNAGRALVDMRPGVFDDVTVLKVETENGRGRASLTVAQVVEFLPPDDATFSVPIEFPVMVTWTGDRISVHVLTMQITADTWGGVVGRSVRRLITRIASDNTHDTVLDFLRTEHGLPLGRYHDYSASALDLIRDPRVDTYSGRFAVGLEGATQHDTVGARGGRRALREAMPAEFERLVAAERVVRAEVGFAEGHAGMEAGAKAILYPTTGRITIRSLLRGGDLLELVETLA